MRRPKTIVGLLGLLAEQRRRRVATLVGGVIAVVALTVAAHGSHGEDGDAGQCGLTEQPWSYGSWKYDHTETLSFGEDGWGFYYLGYDQATRWNVTFRWRRDGDEIVMSEFVHYDDDHERDGEPLDWTVRTGFATERGRFVHEVEHPYGDQDPHVYRCRLRLDRSPDGVDGEQLYFAERER